MLLVKTEIMDSTNQSGTTNSYLSILVVFVSCVAVWYKTLPPICGQHLVS